jgi:hypothetical protein
MLKFVQTEDKLEFTVNEEGNPLFLTYSVIDHGNEAAAGHTYTIQHSRETCFTKKKVGSVWVNSYPDEGGTALNKLIMSGEAGLKTHMEQVYRNLLNKLC